MKNIANVKRRKLPNEFELHPNRSFTHSPGTWIRGDCRGLAESDRVRVTGSHTWPDENRGAHRCAWFSRRRASRRRGSARVSRTAKCKDCGVLRGRPRGPRRNGLPSPSPRRPGAAARSAAPECGSLPVGREIEWLRIRLIRCSRGW